MASSRKSPPGSGAHAVGAVEAALAAAFGAHLQAGSRLAIALSGGIDSMVLLDAACRVTAPALALSAIHVHHGLSPNADRWVDFCAAECAKRSVPLATHRLNLKRVRGTSTEALARTARYACLLACDVDAIALAHHADDQAETLLLQLLRGAGVHGLAAMPGYRPGPPALLRPLLGIARAALLAYAAEHGLSWIDDESNADIRHARNFLRHRVAPLLAARFSGYPATLSRAAQHQAEAAALVDALAETDAAGALEADALLRKRLGTLPAARARNLLRWFLRRHGLRPPTQGRLADMLRQIVHATPDARIRIAHDGAEIGVHRGRVLVHAPATASFVRAWDGQPELRLPGGLLRFERASGAGLAATKLAQAPVTLRSRCGGERIRLAADRPTRTVKKLLQEAHMPPWERDALPLLWSGDTLAAVPGIGVALGFQAAPEEPAWRITWRPLPPP